MKPATHPRPRGEARLLAIDPRRGGYAPAALDQLPDLLCPGDVVVVNDAATLPASLTGRVRQTGAAIELRLVAPAGESRWRAVVMGAGDFRTPTEHRPPPALPATGHDIFDFGAPPGITLSARISDRSALSPRLCEVDFDAAGPRLWAAIYALGRPVQYSYIQEPLPLASVQTAYAARPWSVEMPSAGRPLTWGLLLRLLRRGIAIARLTHAAGLSATGDDALDAALPLPETFELPDETAATIARAKARGGRVIAVGTTVARALEGARTANGQLFGQRGETDLLLDKGYRPHIVDGLVTGMHARGESHYRLLRAFAEDTLLEAATAYADEAGFLAHEMGDVTLIAPDLRLPENEWIYPRPPESGAAEAYPWSALTCARNRDISSASLMSITGVLSYCS